MTEWTDMVEKIKAPKDKVVVGLVGKYIELKDAYLSVAESLRHGGIYNDVDVDIKWIHAEEIHNDNADDVLGDVDGICTRRFWRQRY